MNGNFELPPFLHGCFDWRFNGLQWEAPPPIDLLSDAALSDPNPWIVVASVVERARSGDHASARRLRDFFERREPASLNRIALLVFADTAPNGSLSSLADALQSAEPSTRAHAAEAAALTGSLSLVPAMLAAWERARSSTDHETIGFALSELLEPEPGPIAESVGSYDLPPPEEPLTPAARESYRMVQEAYRDVDSPVLPGLVREALAAHAGAATAGTALWRAAPYDIRAVARELLEIARDNRTHVIYDLRHRFEAFTGIDCRPMLHALRLQPLAIAAIGEAFLQSEAARRYEPGVRYFWGHRIPD